MKFEIRMYAYTDSTFAKCVVIINEDGEIVSFDKIVKGREEVAEEHKCLIEKGMKAETQVVLGKKILYCTTYTA